MAKIFDFFWLQFRESRQRPAWTSSSLRAKLGDGEEFRRSPVLDFVDKSLSVVDKSPLKCRQFIILLQEQY